MKRINISLTDAQLKRLQEYSKRSELNISEIMRRLIDLYFTHLDRLESTEDKPDTGKE